MIDSYSNRGKILRPLYLSLNYVTHNENFLQFAVNHLILFGLLTFQFLHVSFFYDGQ